MKKRYLKIFTAVVLVFAFILVYTVAVTQTSGAPKPAEKKTGIQKTDESDTTDIGEPTNDDPWKELNNLVKAYYLKSGVAYQGTIKVIDGNSDRDKILEEKNFEYTYCNNEYYYSLPPFEVVNTRNFSITVNNDDKVIAVSPKVGERTVNNELFSLADFKNIIEAQNANIKVTQLGDQKILTVDSLQDAEIQGYRIYYSPDNYKINKMLVGMVRPFSLDDDGEDKQGTPENAKDGDSGENGADAFVYYVEINYTGAKQLSLHPKEFSPETKFVKIDGKKVTLTQAFKDYELYNSDEQ